MEEEADRWTEVARPSSAGVWRRATAPASARSSDYAYPVLLPSSMEGSFFHSGSSYASPSPRPLSMNRFPYHDLPTKLSSVSRSPASSSPLPHTAAGSNGVSASRATSTRGASAGGSERFIATLDRDPVVLQPHHSGWGGDDGEEEEVERLRRRVALVEAENAVLRDLLTSAGPPSASAAQLADLRREVRALTLERDAAKAALLNLVETHMTPAYPQMQHLWLGRRSTEGPMGASDKPTTAHTAATGSGGPVMGVSRKAPLQFPPPPPPPQGVRDGSQFLPTNQQNLPPGRRSQTLEGREERRQSTRPTLHAHHHPLPHSDRSNSSSYGHGASRASTAEGDGAEEEPSRTPSRPLFSDSSNCSTVSPSPSLPSPVAAASAPMQSSRLAGAPAHARAPSRGAATAGAAVVGPGISLEGVEALVRRSQQLRQAVDSRNATMLSYC